LQERFGVSERFACRVAGQHRSTQRKARRPVPIDDAKLRALGWAPAHSFGERGLPDTVAWYTENRPWCDAVKSGEYRAYYEEQYSGRLKA